MYRQDAELDGEVNDTLRHWVTGIVNHDRSVIERIHDEDFTCTELGGRLMDRQTHIEMELKTRDVNIEFLDLTNRDFGEFVLTWGRQALAARIPAEDFSAELSENAAAGLAFQFTLVWRRDEHGLRVLTFHASETPTEPVAR